MMNANENQSSLARLLRQSRRLSIFSRLALCAVVAASTAIGCGWLGPSESVRFTYGLGDESEYARLPPLSMKPIETNIIRDEEEAAESTYEKERQRLGKLEALWERGTTPGATRVDFENRRRDLLAYLQESELEDDDSQTYAIPVQQKRNAAYDLLDALKALDHSSSSTPPASLQAYFVARKAYDVWLSGVPVKPAYWNYNAPTPEKKAQFEAQAQASEETGAVTFDAALDAVPRDKNLDDNVAYLHAAALYHDERYTEASASFKDLTVSYPRSEKREAALFMSALAKLKESKSYVREDATALSSAPCADCRDEAWMAARTAFARLIRENPHGRYAADARGWLAYSSLRVGDSAGALAEYYRLVADETNRRARADALTSLAMARAYADADAVSRLEADLSDEPRVALTYAYHNLYNYTADLGADDYQFTGGNDESDGNDSEPPEYDAAAERRLEERKERIAEDAQESNLQRIARFATRMIRRYPHAATGADFTVRVAAADLELGDNRAAHEFARRALALGAAGEERANAVWIKGVAEYRLREYDAARSTLESLTGEKAAGRLTKGARILLALIAEDANDLDGALEQYLQLGYTEDAAYLIDVLMSPEQLAAYIARRPDAAQLDELNYALGVRYLRAARYPEARAAYARVHTSREGDASWTYKDNEGCNKYDTYYSATQTCESPKTATYDTAPGIHERWVLRDLKTAETLEWHERAVAEAQGDEAKAEALYQMASYIYENDLLFYNPAAWRGNRYENLTQLDSLHNYRTPDEARKLWDYSQSHDMAARALALYLEVVRLYPRTRAAHDALYTAAMCHTRLGGYNEYWRTAYANGLYAGARMVTDKDVRAAYPDYQFPRGTYGWQPSTRTVNGGPGWNAPPTPRPRPTRLARIKLLLAAWLPSVINYLRGVTSWLRYWLTIISLVAATFIANRISARTRRQLRTQLARHVARLARLPESAPPPSTRLPTTPPADAPWYTMERATQGWMEQMGARRRPHAAMLYRRLRRRLEPLMHDAPGRAALASNALSHTILLALIFELIRSI